MGEGPVARSAHPDQDALVEVCLGHAGPRTREEVSTHLAGCPACRGAYDELADTVEAVLPAAPRVAPPAGFEGRVLAALAGQHRREGHRDALRGGGGVPAGAGVPRRTVLLAAAAGVLGAAAGAGITAYLGRPGEPPEDPWAAPLLTGGGEKVGTVARGYDDRGTVLVVTVPDGPPGLAVTCLLELTDGRVEDRGRWTLSAERANSWVLPLGDEEVERVDLRTADGSTWASAAW